MEKIYIEMRNENKRMLTVATSIQHYLKSYPEKSDVKSSNYRWHELIY